MLTDFFFASSLSPSSQHILTSSKSIFPQVASQILQKSPADIRCPSRAWKVNLMWEGADDAGGVFDETIAQMCEVKQK